jgi:hypothetical protein
MPVATAIIAMGTFSRINRSVIVLTSPEIVFLADC